MTIEAIAAEVAAVPAATSEGRARDESKDDLVTFGGSTIGDIDFVLDDELDRVSESSYVDESDDETEGDSWHFSTFTVGSFDGIEVS